MGSYNKLSPAVAVILEGRQECQTFERRPSKGHSTIVWKQSAQLQTKRYFKSTTLFLLLVMVAILVARGWDKNLSTKGPFTKVWLQLAHQFQTRSNKVDFPQVPMLNKVYQMWLLWVLDIILAEDHQKTIQPMFGCNCCSSF